MASTLSHLARVPAWVLFLAAAGVVYLDFTVAQVDRARADALADLLSEPVPATVPIAAVKPARSFAQPHELSVMAQVIPNLTLEAARGTLLADAGRDVLHILADADAGSGTLVARGAVVVPEGSESRFSGWLASATVGQGATGPLVVVEGLRAKPVHQEAVNVYLQSHGMYAAEDFVFVTPYLDGRAAALSASPPRSAGLSLLDMIAGALGATGLARIVAKRRRAASAETGPARQDPAEELPEAAWIPPLLARLAGDEAGETPAFAHSATAPAPAAPATIAPAPAAVARPATLVPVERPAAAEPFDDTDFLARLVAQLDPRHGENAVEATLIESLTALDPVSEAPSEVPSEVLSLTPAFAVAERSEEDEPFDLPPLATAALVVAEEAGGAAPPPETAPAEIVAETVAETVPVILAMLDRVPVEPLPPQVAVHPEVPEAPEPVLPTAVSTADVLRFEPKAEPAVTRSARPEPEADLSVVQEPAREAAEPKSVPALAAVAAVAADRARALAAAVKGADLLRRLPRPALRRRDPELQRPDPFDRLAERIRMERLSEAQGAPSRGSGA